MGKFDARELYESDCSHANSSLFLYKCAFAEGKNLPNTDPEKYAFNGPYSLSIQYLLGLGIELFLKAGILSKKPDLTVKFFKKEIRHDLIKANDYAKSIGLTLTAPNFKDILNKLNEPYKAQWLRYSRPDAMDLPRDFEMVKNMVYTLNHEIRLLINYDERPLSK